MFLLAIFCKTSDAAQMFSVYILSPRFRRLYYVVSIDGIEAIALNRINCKRSTL